MQISEIRDKVSQGLLDFAWRQWAQVGVSATVEGADRWAVDPEALILFTIGIGRRDPRLLTRDLEAAGIDPPRRRPAHGTAHLPVFAETSSALLTRLGVAH
jgi:hypothetical protein